MTRTEFVWELHLNTLAQHWRKILLVIDDIANAQYDAILKLSQELHDSHRNFLTIAATHSLDAKELDKFAILNWFASIFPEMFVELTANSSYQQRFLRLHRPFLLRSYREGQYAQSRFIVLSAAPQITRSHRRLLIEGIRCKWSSKWLSKVIYTQPSQ